MPTKAKKQDYRVALLSHEIRADVGVWTLGEAQAAWERVIELAAAEGIRIVHMETITQVSFQ